MTETAIPRIPRSVRSGVPAPAEAIPDGARVLVEHWCATNRDRIVACYQTPRTGHLLVAVIGTEIAYDNRLGDDVAGLEGCLLDGGFRVESTLLPNVPLAELSYFIPPAKAARVDAWVAFG